MGCIGFTEKKSIAGIVITIFLSIFIDTSASAGEILLRVFGPGGPAPAMREAAKAFGEMKGIDVEVTAGPTPAWKDRK